MKKVLVFIVLCVCLNCAAGIVFAGKVIRVPTNITTKVPEYIRAELDEDEPLISHVYEYQDVILIEKHGSEKGVNGSLYIPVDTNSLKGKAEDKPWFGFRNGENSRERIYSVTYKGDETVVVALISKGIETFIDHEALIVDRILPDKVNGKTLVIRNSVPGGFLQSYNTGKKTQIPEAAELLSEKMIRLTFEDGAVEDWILVPGKEDVENNLAEFKEANRLLVWWNGVGKGSLTRSRQRMWNYREGGPEPTAESYSDTGSAKTVSDREAAAAPAK